MKVFKYVWKPLMGTDSHRTISKQSSECWLLIGHKKCFVLLCPISEQFLLSSFREFVHDSYYLATVTRFVHQAFLTRQRSYRWVEKHFGCNLICTEKIQFPDGSQCIVNNRKFKMRRWQESKKSNSSTRKNNNFARASHFVVHFFAVTAGLPRENA